MRHSQGNALQYLVYMLAPKSAEEWAEACSSAAHPETIPTCPAIVRLIQEANKDVPMVQTAHDDLGVGPQAQVRIAPFLPQFPKYRVWTG